MKKYMVICAGVALSLAFTSCKSSQETAYKQAYLKAQAQEEMQQKTVQVPQNEQKNVVAPLEEKPVNQVQVVDNTDNVKVKQEKVSVVDGTGLKDFSVVVGAYRVKAGAELVQQNLKNSGYAAQIVKNEELNIYRVIATTFDTKAEAEASRNELDAKYPGAWLLYNMK